jgi:hypothetical protein
MDDIDDYEIRDGDSDKLKDIKLNLKVVMSYSGPMSEQQSRNVKATKFQYDMFRTMDNLFQNRLSKPNVHLVETESTTFSMSIMHFPRNDTMPEPGQVRSMQSRIHNFRLRPRQYIVPVPSDDAERIYRLDMFACSLQACFNPTIFPSSRFRGIDEPMPARIEELKRTVYLVQNNFKVSVVLRDGWHYIIVSFNMIETDPIAHPEEHELLMIWADSHRPKSIK